VIDPHKDGTVLTNAHGDVVIRRSHAQQRNGDWLLLEEAKSLMAWWDRGYPDLPSTWPHVLPWSEVSNVPVWEADAAVTEAARKYAKSLL
jgi:hypothetical protein